MTEIPETKKEYPCHPGPSNTLDNDDTTSVLSSKSDFFEKKKVVAYIKHEILRKYLDAWLPILYQNPWRTKGRYALSPQYKRIVYVDGFSGPGKYENGDIGSPLLAYERFIIHKCLEKDGPEIFMIFIEKDKAKCKALLQNLTNRKSQVGEGEHINKVQFTVINGEFLRGMKWIISDNFQFPLNSYDKTFIVPDEHTGQLPEKKFVGSETPLLTFIDPFGYSGRMVPMTLIRDILNCTNKAEIFLNLMTGSIRRFFKLDATTKAINLLVGEDEDDAWWKPVILEEPDNTKALQTFLKMYDDKVTELCNNKQKFTSMFWMRDHRNILLYNLYFVSHHNTGFQRMKAAMSAVTHSDSKFTFSAFDAKRPNFKPQRLTIEELTEDIVEEFNEMSPVVGQDITEYIERSSTLIQKYKNKLKQSLQPYYPRELHGRQLKFDEIQFNFTKQFQIDNAKQEAEDVKPKRRRKQEK